MTVIIVLFCFPSNRFVASFLDLKFQRILSLERSNNLTTGNCFEPPLKLSLLGIWLEAEKMVRYLSVRHSHVYVISGSIFDENADGHRDADSNITRFVLRSLYLLSIVLIMLSLYTHLFAQQRGENYLGQV